MYGTVARLRLKSGMEGALLKEQEAFEALGVPGYLGASIYRMDADPGECYLVVAFESKAAYEANAQDPAQDQRFQKIRALLTADPEWHDGEILHRS